MIAGPSRQLLQVDHGGGAQQPEGDLLRLNGRQDDLQLAVADHQRDRADVRTELDGDAGFDEAEQVAFETEELTARAARLD